MNVDRPAARDRPGLITARSGPAAGCGPPSALSTTGENPSGGRAVAGFRQVSVFSSVIFTARASVRNGDPMIHAKGLTKRFGSTVAVCELSFDVRPGTVTGFLGPNGSGKPDTDL